MSCHAISYINNIILLFLIISFHILYSIQFHHVNEHRVPRVPRARQVGLIVFGQILFLSLCLVARRPLGDGETRYKWLRFHRDLEGDVKPECHVHFLGASYGFDMDICMALISF